MYKYILSLLLTLSFVAANAQEDHVITIHQDTLYGSIQILLPTPHSEEIILKTDDGKDRYKAYQFTEFTYEGDTYVPVKTSTKYAIMKVKKEGYLSLLSYRAENNYDFGNLYLLKKTGEGTELPTFLWKKVMTDFLSNCPEVTTKIEDKTYKRNDIEDIVDVYNNCILDQTSATYSDNSKRATPAKTATPNKDNPAVTLIYTIKGKLTAYDNSDTEDIMALLTDMAEKLSEDEKIPSYMIGALNEQAKEFKSIEEDIDQLVEMIKK
ncbi:hypothetical protein [Fulvivirga ligni]|uniref:hypothetical protein n=1 Tax=Fulvivirga ligni TaxID=2904246 RepID=UPI001F1FD3B7|nr:hypothetical protein [Fulvivirga ligni]UII20213.1 hypothetical protein LVD16_20410 [Fulvivirga ligni]